VSTNPNHNNAAAAVVKIAGADGNWEVEKARWWFVRDGKTGETPYFYEAKRGGGRVEPLASIYEEHNPIKALFP
jgi:hypothetical protein